MKRLILFLGICLLCISIQAQTGNKDVATWLTQQKANKTLKRISVFKGTAASLRSDKLRKTVSDFHLVNLDRNAIKNTRRTNDDLLELDIPISANKQVRLHLAKAQILSDDFKLSAASGKAYPSSLMGVHYRGTVDGEAGTFASISFFDGEMMGMISTKTGNYIIGELEDDSKRYIIYNDKNLRGSPEGSCGTPDHDVPHFEENTGLSERRALGDVCKIVKLYWEADNGLFIDKGTMAESASYIAGAFNQMAALYQNDGIIVQLSGTLIWDTADPYGSTSSSAALNSFQARWNGQGNAFNGDLAHLVALDPGGLGGLAYRGVLCVPASAYAYSDITNSFSSVPTYSWTIELLAHEIGHNLGSRHTHACAWNGNNTPIDDCGSQYYVTNGVDDDMDLTTDELDEATEAAACFDNVDNTIPTTGTIMSYCHLISGVGIDFNNGFGTQPKAVIQAAINGAACLDNTISLTTTKTDICASGAGMIDLTVSGIGTPGYSYAWSPGGATSQDLISISDEGTYSVLVTDANNCTNTTNVELVIPPVPGNGDNSLQCSTADFDVALATTGMSLGTDEVVGWWVTGTNPISSSVNNQITLDKGLPSSAGGTILGASPNVVFESTSGSSLDLSVAYDDLVEGQIYYATPFVSAKKAGISERNCSRTFNSSGVTVGATPGAWVFSSAVSCAADGRPSPPDFTIDVNVTTYAGAANQLTILFRAVGCSGSPFIADFGNAGTGTYTFTQADFPTGTDPTGGFCILLYDQTQPATNSIAFNAAVDITYAAIPEVTFPSVSYTSCLFGTAIPFSVDNTCVVPVELRSFTAVKNKNQVDLKWITSSERNADFFEVQRSTNGIDFDPIGQVDAAGNSSREIRYDFIDKNPLPGNNFYRLMQVDQDRKIDFSKIREVLFTKKGIVSIYPIPVNGDAFILKYDSHNREDINVNLYDVAGKLISRDRIEVERGLNEIQIGAERLPEGIYLLQVIQGETIQTKQFIRA